MLQSLLAHYRSWVLVRVVASIGDNTRVLLVRLVTSHWWAEKTAVNVYIFSDCPWPVGLILFVTYFTSYDFTRANAILFFLKLDCYKTTGPTGNICRELKKIKLIRLTPRLKENYLLKNETFIFRPQTITYRCLFLFLFSRFVVCPFSVPMDVLNYDGSLILFEPTCRSVNCFCNSSLIYFYFFVARMSISHAIRQCPFFSLYCEKENQNGR